MPVFKPMKRGDLLKAIEGHKDVISPVFKNNEELFKLLSCPECGGEVMRVVNPKAIFREGSILPNFLGRCKVCGVEFEPHTGVHL